MVVYPRAEKIFANAIEQFSLDDEIDEVSKELSKSALLDFLVDTLITQVAVAKHKKVVAKEDQIVHDSLYNLLVDVVNEAVKKVCSDNMQRTAVLCGKEKGIYDLKFYEEFSARYINCGYSE